MENEVVIYPSVEVSFQKGYITLNNEQYSLNQPIAIPSGTYHMEVTLIWEHDMFGAYISKSKSINTDKSREQLKRTNKITEYTYLKEVNFTPGIYHFELAIEELSKQALEVLESSNAFFKKQGMKICRIIGLSILSIGVILMLVQYFQYIQEVSSFNDFIIGCAVTMFFLAISSFILLIWYLIVKGEVKLTKEDLIPKNLSISKITNNDIRTRGIRLIGSMRKEESHFDK